MSCCVCLSVQLSIVYKVNWPTKTTAKNVCVNIQQYNLTI